MAQDLEPRSRSKGEVVARLLRPRSDEEIGFKAKPDGINACGCRCRFDWATCGRLADLVKVVARVRQSNSVALEPTRSHLWTGQG